MPKSFFEVKWSKILELESFLKKHQYFSKDYLPGKADALMFQIFDCQFPKRTQYPSIYYWFINIKQFAPEAIKKWDIKSDCDCYFQEFLEQYKIWKEKTEFIIPYSLKNLEQQNIYFNDQKPEYTINVIFNVQQKSEITELVNKIDKKGNIKGYEYLKDSIKLQIKCTQKQMSSLKLELDSCKNVTNYELRKQRHVCKKRSSLFVL